MSSKIKCVQINLEESIYEHLNKYLKYLIENVGIPKCDLSYYLKCCCINRLIEIRVLNEFAMPNPLCLPPEINSTFPEMNGSISFDDLREACKEEK